MPICLARFQDAFAQALLAPPDAEPPAEVSALAAQPGFAVFRNTVLKGCVDALQANYPAVARLAGEEWFRAAAAIFARAHLPRNPSLLDYGRGFAAFLEGFAPAAEFPWLPQVAQLDRYWTEAHAARDAAALDPAALARLSSKELARAVLRPHPSARWAWFADRPIFTLWRRNREASGDEHRIVWRGEGALLARPRDAVQWIALDAAGCSFLDACARGCTVAEAAEAALAARDDADLAQLTAALLRAGAFSRARRADTARIAEKRP